MTNALAAADAAAELIVTTTPELVMYKPTHLVMSAIENIHVMGGIPYWEAIVVMTLMLRFMMLPLAVQTMQNAMRMAVLRPHMQRLQDVYLKDPHFEDMRVKLKYHSDMKALFVQHTVTPFRSLLMPLFQLPVFISFFLGLQGMGEYFPALATGGTLWFTDLSAADPYFIFPVLNAASFLVMIEMGADGMQTSQQETFKWAMRGLGVAMAPMTMSIPQAVFIYWTTNNCFSLVQTVIMKQEAVRTYLDIPKPPAPEDQPALKMKNPLTVIAEAVRKEATRNENAAAEIVDAKMQPPPPPPGAPPPVTFAAPPTKPKKRK